MFWLKILSIGKSAAPYIAAASAVVAVLGYVYNLGGDNREASIQAALNEKYADDVAKLPAQIQSALDVQEADFQDRLKADRDSRVTVTETKEVIKYVDKIQIDPECMDLAIDFIGLFQRPASNSEKCADGASSVDNCVRFGAVLDLEGRPGAQSF